MDSLIGNRLGRFPIFGEIGSGGMGDVYWGYHPRLLIPVAIKVIRKGYRTDTETFTKMVDRFEVEAAIVAKIQHPNIVRIYDYDFDEELEAYYMVMGLVDGPTLKDEISTRKSRRHPFKLEQVCSIFKSLAGAVDYAHQMNTVHHDLKPANILFTLEPAVDVMLTDFGIAKLKKTSGITLDIDPLGTPAYMSPEQCRGERGDHRSDIYSLGVILYETILLRRPFSAANTLKLIQKQILELPTLPTKINPEISESIETVILKSLDKKPENRFQTAGELADALQHAVNPDRLYPIVLIAPQPKFESANNLGGDDWTVFSDDVAGDDVVGDDVVGDDVVGDDVVGDDVVGDDVVGDDVVGDDVVGDDVAGDDVKIPKSARERIPYPFRHPIWLLITALLLLICSSGFFYQVITNWIPTQTPARGAITSPFPNTPTPTDTSTSTPTDTSTPTPTDTSTSTPTDTSTSTPTDTSTSTPTGIPSNTPFPTSNSPDNDTLEDKSSATIIAVNTATATSTPIPTPIPQVQRFEAVYHDSMTKNPEGIAFYAPNTGAIWLDLLVQFDDENWYGPEREENDAFNPDPLPDEFHWETTGGFLSNKDGEAWWKGLKTETDGVAILYYHDVELGDVEIGRYRLEIAFDNPSTPTPSKEEPVIGG